MKSCWRSTDPLSQYDWCPYKKGESGHTHTHTHTHTEHYVLYCYKPGNHSREVWNRPFPVTHRSNMVLPTSQSQTFSLKNCKTVDFCCLSHLACATLLQQPEQTNTPPQSNHRQYTNKWTPFCSNIMLFIKRNRCMDHSLPTLALTPQKGS
jgi:hypothetical protein